MNKFYDVLEDIIWLGFIGLFIYAISNTTGIYFILSLIMLMISGLGYMFHDTRHDWWK